jgi:hypothetical protein
MLMKYSAGLLLVLFAVMSLAFLDENPLFKRVETLTPEKHNYHEVKRCLDCKGDGLKIMMRSVGLAESGNENLDSRGWMASSHATSQVHDGVNTKECASCHAPLESTKNFTESGELIPDKSWTGVSCNACHPDTLVRQLRKSLIVNLKPYSDRLNYENFTFYHPESGAERNKQCAHCHIEVHQFTSELKAEMVASGEMRCIDCHMPAYDIYEERMYERMHNFKVAANIPHSCGGMGATISCHGEADQTWMVDNVDALVETVPARASCKAWKKEQHNNDFLGDIRPGIIPKLFAAPAISSRRHEHSAPAITPEGDEIFWAIAYPELHLILQVKREAGKWGEVSVAPFSGKYWDDLPTLSPDGSTLYFISKRPQGDEEKSSDKNRLWKVQRTETGWSEPQFVGQLIPGWDILLPSFTKEGHVYFATERDDGYGKYDIYRSEYKDGEYQEPVLLGDQINTAGVEMYVCVTPDESLLLFTNWGTDDYDGLKISRRNEDGSWGRAVKVGDYLSPQKAIRFYSFSPDGKYLFFNCQVSTWTPYLEAPVSMYYINELDQRIENGKGNIYWVNFESLMSKYPFDKPFNLLMKKR